MSDQPDLASCFQAQRDDSMSAQGNALGNLPRDDFQPQRGGTNFQRPAARLSPCPKTNPRSRARQEADVKPRFLTGAAPNLALLFADDATTAESILARKFRSAPLGLFVPDIPKPRTLPWADLWLARWAGTQTVLHSNAACWAASNFSDTHTLRMIQSRL